MKISELKRVMEYVTQTAKTQRWITGITVPGLRIDILPLCLRVSSQPTFVSRQSSQSDALRFLVG